MRRWIVVGAGLTGATLAERIAVKRGEPVTVFERRGHIAGNVHDFTGPHGLTQPLYGPHIFHTASRQVWDYVRRFATWTPYQHRVVAEIDGRHVPVPFNVTGMRALMGDRAEPLIAALVGEYGRDARVPVLKLRDHADANLRELGAFVYATIFEGYSNKQWGRPVDTLLPSVSARVPVVAGEDDRYFTDPYQAMPDGGYTAMVARMLDHPNIRVELETPYPAGRDEPGGTTIIHTGEIDAYFGRSLGALPYRSVRFETEHRRAARALPAASVNYPDARPYTRVTEAKTITGEASPWTALIRDYPCAHVPGETEPYYPIPAKENAALYNAYAALARRRRVVFGGRLGSYQYLNMDQAIGGALALFARLERFRA